MLSLHNFVIFIILQDQKKQVKTTTSQFGKIFSFLEKTLLRGREEKRKFLEEQKKKEIHSNILESMQPRTISDFHS